MVTMTGGEIDAMARELAGRRVENVRYYMLPVYGLTEVPSWDRQVAHATDYGIDLVTPDGTMGITWASYGEYGYGLRIVRGPVLTMLSHAEFWCVADELPWGAVRGERITRAQVHWLDVRWGDKDTSGPVALSLRFPDSIGIVIVCGSWTKPQEAVFPTGDDIVVLWQPETLPVLAPFLPADLVGL
jgi:hypothetical protein